MSLAEAKAPILQSRCRVASGDSREAVACRSVGAGKGLDLSVASANFAPPCCETMLHFYKAQVVARHLGCTAEWPPLLSSLA